MVAYGDDPQHHAIRDETFVCTAPPDAPCRTSPTCECENWCGCDGSPEDAKDNHDDDSCHCCMLTVKPGQDCWLEPWVNGAGLSESSPDAPYVDGKWPDGPVTCEWEDGVYFKYVEAG